MINTASRIVRVGLIQNQIVLPTNAAVGDQRAAIWNRVSQIAESAAASGVNILCLQEAWSKFDHKYLRLSMNTDHEQMICPRCVI